MARTPPHTVDNQTAAGGLEEPPETCPLMADISAEHWFPIDSGGCSSSILKLALPAMMQEVVVKSQGRVLMSLRSLKKVHHIQLLVLLLFVTAALLTLLVFLASFNLAAHGLSLGGRRLHLLGPSTGTPRIAPEVAMALLHFATTSEVPQQSKEEISEILGVLLERGPCNMLVYGMWHDSLLWASFNYGGRTVFLDESQFWIDIMRERHPQLETYKVDYSTKLGEADKLLSAARESLGGDCRPHQPIQSSACPLALSNQLPLEVMDVEWDLILIDGPRSYMNASFPGRMAPIFTSSVMAHSRISPGHVDIFLHDVSRPTENEYGLEFLCFNNMLKQVGELWHFQIHPTTSPDFCRAS